MKNYLKSITVLVLVLAVTQVWATDQAPTPVTSANAAAISPPASATPPAVAPQPTPPTRDPTVPSAELRSVLDKSGRSTAGPGRAAVKAPEIVLRGRIQVAGKPVTALIEVGGKGLYAITEGSRLTVDGGHGESLTLQVGRLTLEEVEIEIVGQHQKVTVR